MTQLNIRSKLIVEPYDFQSLEIPLLQGQYDITLGDEQIILVRSKECFDPDAVVWDFVGEDGYSSICSDSIFLTIKDRKTESPEIDHEWLIDNVEDSQLIQDVIYYAIPCGTGGCAFVYTVSNEKGQVIAFKITGEFDE